MRLHQPIVLLRRGGWAKGEVKLGARICVCLCAHRIVLPAHLMQSMCISETGAENTVAMRPKYFVAQRSANVYRTIRNAPGVFENFPWWLPTLSSLGRKFRWYHSI